MRHPMGGAGFQQAPQKGSNSMGLIMPLYTVGIIAFFVYTIMKVKDIKISVPGSFLQLFPFNYR